MLFPQTWKRRVRKAGSSFQRPQHSPRPTPRPGRRRLLPSVSGPSRERPEGPGGGRGPGEQHSPSWLTAASRPAGSSLRGGPGSPPHVTEHGCGGISCKWVEGNGFAKGTALRGSRGMEGRAQSGKTSRERGRGGAAAAGTRARARLTDSVRLPANARGSEQAAATGAQPPEGREARRQDEAAALTALLGASSAFVPGETRTRGSTSRPHRVLA